MKVDGARAKSIFLAASEIADTEQREKFLEQQCGSDAPLRARVEALLRADGAAGVQVEKLSGAALGATVDAQAIALPGTLIAGRYKLRQQIGEGGMGTVWMADQTEPVKRKVAVKLISVERGQSKTILARFDAERQAIALMDHPHIAKLFDAGTTQTGAPFFVMELVKGIPLIEFCDQHKLTILERLNLFTQICSAVQHAHQKGIIHRDLKPSNILVESHDGKPVPKVIDFGLAKATSSLQLTEKSMFTAFGSVMGTPLYMAPEQAGFNAVDIDTRADVYALGVILYELLTGTTPITRETLRKAALDEMLRIVREQEAPTPSSRLSSLESAPSVAACRQMERLKLGRFVKGELDWIVLKALSKDRNRRYETANGFAQDIERFINHEPVTAGPPSASYRVRKFVQRYRGQVLAAGLVALALIVGVIGTTFGLLVAKQQARETSAARVRETDQRLRAEGERDEKEKARKVAVAEKERADREKAIAEAVKDFVSKDVFGRAGDQRLGQSVDIKARTLLEEAAKTVGEKFKDQPEIELEVRYSLGKGFLQMGLTHLALEQGPRLLELCRKHKPLDDPTSLDILTDLALAALHSDQSLLWSREAFEGFRQKYGDDDLLTAEAAAQRVWILHQREPIEAMRLCEYYLPISRQKTGETSDLSLSLLAYKALLLSQSGKIEDALTIYRQVHDVYEKMGMDWSLRPRHGTWYFIANLLVEQRKTSEAIPLFLDDIARLSQTFGADHAEVTYRRNGLAKAYWINRAYLKATPVYFDVAEGERRTHGPRSQNALAAQSQAVICLFIMDRLEIATARAESWASSDKADDLANAASLLCMIAKESKDRDKINERQALEIEKNKARAMQFLQRAVDRGWRDKERLEEFAELRDRREYQVLVNRLINGQSSTYPAVIAGQASSLRQDRKYLQAIEKYLEAIRLQEIEVARFPDEEQARESLGNFYTELGSTYKDNGEPDRALKSHENAYDVRVILHREATSARKPEFLGYTAWSLHHQGRIHLDEGRYEQAAELASAAAAIRETLLPGQPEVSPYRVAASADFDLLGRTWERAGRFPESEAAYRRALELRETVMHGNFDVTGHRADVDWSRRQLAAVLIKLGRFAEARDIYRENLDLYRKTNELGVHDALVNLGATLLRTKEWQEAEVVLRECLERRQKQIPDSWMTFNTQSLLGGAMLGQKKYADAESLLLKGYEGMKAREQTIPKEGKARLPEALERLVQLYTDWHAVEPEKNYDVKVTEWKKQWDESRTAGVNATPSDAPKK